MSRPGRCGWLAPAHPPGASRKVGRSTTGRSSGVSLRSTYTSPVVPEGMAGDARCGPVSGCPAPLPLAPPPVARRRCRLESVLSANRPPFPKLDPAPVARTSVLAPFTLTRLPVPSLGGASDRRVLGCSWGAPVASAGASLPVASGKPAARGLEALPLRSPPRLPGARRFRAAPPLAAPVARCSSLRSVASRPVRSRLRLVDQSRFPLPSARRLRSEDSVISPRLACAPRYVGYLRERITAGQGVFLNPQGYPRTFSSIPRNLLFFHRSCTGMSPDL